MKKLILTIAIAAMGITAVFAQDTTKRVRRAMPKLSVEQRAQKATDMLDKKLSFTADQKTKVYAIQLDRAKQIETLRNEDKADLKKNGKKMKADMQASSAKLEDILTADQKVKYSELKSQMKDKMMKGRKQGMGKDKAPVVSNPPSQG